MLRTGNAQGQIYASQALCNMAGDFQVRERIIAAGQPSESSCLIDIQQRRLHQDHCLSAPLAHQGIILKAVWGHRGQCLIEVLSNLQVRESMIAAGQPTLPSLPALTFSARLHCKVQMLSIMAFQYH